MTRRTHTNRFYPPTVTVKPAPPGTEYVCRECGCSSDAVLVEASTPIGRMSRDEDISDGVVRGGIDPDDEPTQKIDMNTVPSARPRMDDDVPGSRPALPRARTVRCKREPVVAEFVRRSDGR